MVDHDIDRFEDEGAPVLTVCSRCGRVRPLFHDDYCLTCWVFLNPPAPPKE